MESAFPGPKLASDGSCIDIRLAVHVRPCRSLVRRPQPFRDERQAPADHAGQRGQGAGPGGNLLDWGTDGKGQALPFAVSRPLLRLGAGQRAKVEVLYQGQGLPTDRETYLLLSVLDVPHATGKGDALQIALRHRFKLFYRPSLKATVEQAMAGLTWSYDPEGSPRTRNPSPYYVTLSQVEFLDAPGRLCAPPIDHLMLAPYTEHSFDSIDCQAIKARYEVVSDAGNLRPFQVILPTNGKATANPL